MATSMPEGSGTSMGCEYPSVNTTVPLPFISARYPMPTISSSRVQPLVTPCTALKTSARVKPCTAACLSISRFTCNSAPTVSSEMPSAISAETLPLGPSTRTVLPSTLYLTPAGSEIGFFPIRDIVSILLLACESRQGSFQRPRVPLQPVQQGSEIRDQGSVRNRYQQICRNLIPDPCSLPLPHFAEQLAAHAFAACLAAGHHTLGRGHDGDSKTALDALDLVAADIHSAARTRDARQVADGCFGAAVLQVHAQHRLAFLFLGLVVRDIPLLLEDAGNLGLQLRSRNIQLLMARPDCIPDPRQKICYWVSQTQSFSFIPRSLPVLVAPSSGRTRGNVTTVVSDQSSKVIRSDP